MRILYSFLLHLLALVYLPKVLYLRVWKGKYRKRRWCAISSFPKKDPSRHLVWVHAVSLGEIRAIAPLVKKIKSSSLSPQVIVSCLTETGYEEAKKLLPEADSHGFLPLDLPYVMKRLIKRSSPDLVLLSETDFWFNFLYFSKKRGADICLINGKMSESSFRRYSFLPFFSKPLFSLFDHLFVQSDEYSHRFVHFLPKEKITVTGNLKMKSPTSSLAPEEKEKLRERLGINKNDTVLTIGSTHAPEEKIFLQFLPDLFKKNPSLKVLLVPRHPERFSEVRELLEKSGLPFGCYTKHAKAPLLLIDHMGILRDLYQLSDVAFVGGSLAPKVGGHNIYEPISYGIPTLFGPYMQNQREMKETALQHKAAIETREENLADDLEELVLFQEKREALSRCAKQWVTNLERKEEKLFSFLPINSGAQ